MGHDFSLTPEDLENIDKKNKLLKAPVSYRAENLEIPDLEKNFIPGEVKKKKTVKLEVVDLKKSKKKKSNSLL